MGPFVSNVRDVAEKHLCTGCGACAWYRPDAIEMVDDLDRGRRPLVASGGKAAAREALDVCPGHRLGHEPFGPEVVPELVREWGPVLEVWEGYAFDPGLRLAASSGGAATALRAGWTGSLGIHTHNNKSLAVQTSLHAMKIGVEFLDATVLGSPLGMHTPTALR